MNPATDHPVQLDVDHPEGLLDRLPSAFRAKYPRWFHEFDVADLRFDDRIFGCLLLRRDGDPPFRLGAAVR